MTAHDGLVWGFEGSGRSTVRWSWRRTVAVLPGPSTTPFAFWYLVVLLSTTAVLVSADQGLTSRLLTWSSTDAHNLGHHPVLALLASALWLPDRTTAAGYLVAIALVVGWLERRIGTGWAIAVFASGHVIATLVTELPIMWAISQHLLPGDDARWLDVGVSYGVFTVVGVLLQMLPGNVRWWCALGVALYLAGQVAQSDPMALGTVVTTSGHVLAILVGLLGWRPWLRHRGMVSAPPPSPA